MPLPTRRGDESHQEFIDRCMGDKVMQREFPDAQQRRAVCQQQAKLKGESFLNLVCEPGAITMEAAEDGDGDGKPRLPRFTMVAYTGGPMRIAGWRFPVVVDLAGLSIPSQSRPIRFGHDMASGVGHTDAIRVEEGRLLATGLVSRDTAAAKEIVASARNGFPWQASIAAAVDQFEFVKENQKATVNGREFAGPLNVIRKATLGEISFVDLGADGQTSASVAAAALYNRKENEEMAAMPTPTRKPRSIRSRRPLPSRSIPTGSRSARPRSPRRPNLPVPRRPSSGPRPSPRRTGSPRSASSAAASTRRLRRRPSATVGNGTSAPWKCCGPAAPRRRPPTSATTTSMRPRSRPRVS